MLLGVPERQPWRPWWSISGRAHPGSLGVDDLDLSERLENDDQGPARCRRSLGSRARGVESQGLNSIIKKVKRVGAGFRKFANYRLRILQRHPN
jgi:hypothetical protein